MHVPDRCVCRYSAGGAGTAYQAPACSPDLLTILTAVQFALQKMGRGLSEMEVLDIIRDLVLPFIVISHLMVSPFCDHFLILLFF